MKGPYDGELVTDIQYCCEKKDLPVLEADVGSGVMSVKEQVSLCEMES